MEQKKVALVLPVYNEVTHIERVYEAIKGLPYHVIFVDDGSTDGTREKLATFAGVTVLTHAINRGVGAATQTGIDGALRQGMDIVVTMDADEQHFTEDIPKVIAPLLAGEVDVVIGSRFLKKNQIPLLRRFYNWVGNIITWLLSGIILSDSQSGFKGFTKEALKDIRIHANGYEFCSEIIREISWNKTKFKEVPISVKYTKASLSKGQSFSDGIETLFKLLVRSLLK